MVRIEVKMMSIKLRTSDGHIIEIDDEMIRMSQYITYICDHYFNNNSIIPFNNSIDNTFTLIYLFIIIIININKTK
jgi:hypothetical protein